MTKKSIFTPNAPAPVGPYSQAVRFNDLIFVSGQIPLDPQTSAIINDSFESESKTVLNHLKTVVEAAGSTMEKVIKVTIYLKDMNHFPIINTIYNTYFSEPYPARAVVEVARLPKDVNIEIEAIASL